MVNYTRKTFFDASIVFILLIVAAVFAYLFRILLARNLTLADYGLFFSLVAFAGILALFRDMGVGYSATYFIPRYLAKKEFSKIKFLVSRVLLLCTLLTVGISLLVIVLSPFLAQYYFHIDNTIILLLFIIAFSLNGMEIIFQVFFNAFQHNILYSFHNLLRNVLLFLLVFFGFIYFKGIMVPLFVSIVVYGFLLLLFSFIFFRKIFPSYFDTVSSAISSKELLLFGFSASLSSLGFLFITSTDTLLLTYFRSLEEVGLYNGVIPIVTIILYVPYAISAVMNPLIAELWTKKKKILLQFSFEKIIRFLLVLLIPVVVLILAYPEFILTLCFGEKFISASVALMILSVGIIFFALAQIATGFIFAIKGPKENIILYAIAAIINIILNIVLIPTYGIVGAAIATTISYLLLFILSLRSVSKILKIYVPWKTLFFTLFSGVLFLLIINFLKTIIFFDFILLKIVVIVGIAGLIYFGFIFLFRIITFQELYDLKTQIFKK